MGCSCGEEVQPDGTDQSEPEKAKNEMRKLTTEFILTPSQDERGVIYVVKGDIELFSLGESVALLSDSLGSNRRSVRCHGISCLEVSHGKGLTDRHGWQIESEKVSRDKIPSECLEWNRCNCGLSIPPVWHGSFLFRHLPSRPLGWI